MHKLSKSCTKTQVKVHRGPGRPKKDTPKEAQNVSARQCEVTFISVDCSSTSVIYYLVFGWKIEDGSFDGCYPKICEGVASHVQVPSSKAKGPEQEEDKEHKDEVSQLLGVMIITGLPHF